MSRFGVCEFETGETILPTECTPEGLLHWLGRGALPPEEAGKALNWAHQLADLAGERTVEWSDSWTDEDLADATAAAVHRFEDQEREDH